MRTPKAARHSLPFADRVLANTLSPADVEHLGWVADPRWHDLPEDTHLWLGLLAAARTLDGDAPLGLFGALHGLRCLGARLHPTRTGVRLRAGEMRWDEYLALREEYLMPHAATLRRLLALPPTTDEVESLTA
jgi:hypothetical protein